MTAKDPAAPGFKEKAKDEFKDFLVIAGYSGVLLLRALDLRHAAAEEV